MKRHPGLRDLSSDHHQGLVHARHLVKAATQMPESQPTTQEAAQAFLTFWNEHINRHFREEEEVLLPAFARYGDPWEPPVVRMLVEHIQIRRLVSDLANQVTAGSGTPSSDTMHALGTLLHDHIRHEEDVLFPLIESAIPSEVLLGLPEAFSTFG
jgi:hemerythrin-like domain-containing protein